MNGQYTPGPWVIGTNDTEKVLGGGTGVAVMSGWDKAAPEREANARLIAAAPELVEALRAIAARARDDRPVVEACGYLYTDDESGDVLDMARAALARAGVTA